MNLSRAPILSKDRGSRVPRPATTPFTRWSRWVSSRAQSCRRRVWRLVEAARGLRDEEAWVDDERAPWRQLTRAEEINRLPWDEQLQVAQAASDEAKAMHGRRASCS